MTVAALLVLGGCHAEVADSEPMSEAEGRLDVEGRHAEELRGLADDLGIVDPPAVDVVRVVALDESVGARQLCMEELGFPVEGPTAGILEWEVSEGQQEAFSLALYTCTARYPIAAEDMAPLDETQMGALYDHWQDETIPCLEALGYAVEQPPSRESFVEGGVVWDPRESTYESVMLDVERGRWADEESVYSGDCPTEP